ncbi:MAG TPA: hypothetical protein PLL06_17315, partial [Acidobacteriota bacterium]|nr:hypothetical protein [Acidobacteriota bacterium]
MQKCVAGNVCLHTRRKNSKNVTQGWFLPLLVLLFIGLSFVAGAFVQAKEDSHLDLQLAARYFREAKELSDRDGGRTWGVPLYGPILLVNPETRQVVANQADTAGNLKSNSGVFTGMLPADVTCANTATIWAGVEWTMMLWPLPSSQQERARLITHELFHRIQEEIQFPASNPVNAHLESEAGRVWLRLEFRALERALQETGSTRKKAVTDALNFRQFRQALGEMFQRTENELELNEGLAEYTGVRLCAHSQREADILAAYGLRQAHAKATLSRSFAYATGPAYGCLLDSVNPVWRKQLNTNRDLAHLAGTEFGIKLKQLDEPKLRAVATAYFGEELFEFESVRATRRRTQLAQIQSQLIDGPTVELPLDETMNYSFDPNTVVTVDDNRTVYPSLQLS